MMWDREDSEDEDGRECQPATPKHDNRYEKEQAADGKAKAASDDHASWCLEHGLHDGNSE
jgi:hypothetical protein